MDCSSPGSSVHGILQTRTLRWVAIPFSRGSSRPRDRTWVSCTACGFIATEPQGSLTERRGSTQAEQPQGQVGVTKTVSGLCPGARVGAPGSPETALEDRCLWGCCPGRGGSAHRRGCGEIHPHMECLLEKFSVGGSSFWHRQHLKCRVTVWLCVCVCACTRRQRLTHLSWLEDCKNFTVVEAPLKQPKGVSASKGSETPLQAKVCLWFSLLGHFHTPFPSQLSSQDTQGVAPLNTAHKPLCCRD